MKTRSSVVAPIGSNRHDSVWVNKSRDVAPAAVGWKARDDGRHPRIEELLTWRSAPSAPNHYTTPLPELSSDVFITARRGNRSANLLLGLGWEASKSNLLEVVFKVPTRQLLSVASCDRQTGNFTIYIALTPLPRLLDSDDRIDCYAHHQDARPITYTDGGGVEQAVHQRKIGEQQLYCHHSSDADPDQWITP